MTISKEDFGKLPGGEQVYLFTLDNGKGMRVQICNYGGIVTTLEVPDHNGRPGDVVLGFDRLAPYLEGHPYFGAIVGRYANRIAAGKFNLNDREFILATNNGPNHLHGGVKGFDKALWEAKEVKNKEGVGVELGHISPDGDEGYPGLLKITVTYTLTVRNEFKISYRAESDRPTPVNLTHHGYFNLSGAGNGDVLSHLLTIRAHRYTPMDDTLIPTGEISPVAGTPLDFTTAHSIGDRIEKTESGYDHNFVLNGWDGSLRLAASVVEPTSGRAMDVYTTEPGLQFYSGNFLDGSLRGKGDKKYARHFGFCLETQHFPDSPNRPEFPNTILRPGSRYRQVTVYKFYTTTENDPSQHISTSEVNK